MIAVHLKPHFRAAALPLKPNLLSALACVLTLASVPLRAAEPTSLSSPEGDIQAEVAPLSESVANPVLSVHYRGQELLRAALGLRVAGTDLLEHAVLRESRTRASDSTYRLSFGKNNPVRDHFAELRLEFGTTSGPVQTLEVLIRAYDDGVAFRYVIPQQPGAEMVEITDEPTRFWFAGDPQTWPLYRENYTTSHEGLYTVAAVSELATNRLIDLPLLAQFTNGVSVGISEANLRNYAGLYFKVEVEGAQRWLRGDLSPLPGQTVVKVRSKLPLASPWRVLLIGAEPGRLLESDLILNLNERSVVPDSSWIKIGKTTWYWWNGPYQEPVGFKVGLNFETMMHYIDFCAANGIAFHSVISTTDEHPWYHQSQPGFAPGPDTDVTRPRAGFPMEQVAEYARSKGVGLRLWVHWKPLSERLDQAFAQYQKWGISGLMVDFLDRDDQEMVLFAERVLRSAAHHHLHIQFHGVWKPTGLQRTFPNLLNHEGVLNLEYLKWSDLCSPDHNLKVAFTRLLAGPMDYHLGGFRSVNPENFKPVSTKPSVLGTRCHHLAMYVVYENPMPMVCDAPTAYEGQPGFDFIRQVPTTWDETRVLSGQVGHYIVVARRKGREWYVGAMTDWTARELEVPLDFLPPGRHQIATWADALNSEDPNQLTYRQHTVESHDKLLMRLAGGGGQVARIR